MLAGTKSNFLRFPNIEILRCRWRSLRQIDVITKLLKQIKHKSVWYVVSFSADLLNLSHIHWVKYKKRMRYLSTYTQACS